MNDTNRKNLSEIIQGAKELPIQQQKDLLAMARGMNAIKEEGETTHD